MFNVRRIGLLMIIFGITQLRGREPEDITIADMLATTKATPPEVPQDVQKDIKNWMMDNDKFMKAALTNYAPIKNHTQAVQDHIRAFLLLENPLFNVIGNWPNINENTRVSLYTNVSNTMLTIASAIEKNLWQEAYNSMEALAQPLNAAGIPAKFFQNFTIPIQTNSKAMYLIKIAGPLARWTPLSIKLIQAKNRLRRLRGGIQASEITWQRHGVETDESSYWALALSSATNASYVDTFDIDDQQTRQIPFGPKTYQTISRAYGQMLIEQAIEILANSAAIPEEEKNIIRNIMLPASGLANVPGLPEELSDRNYIWVEGILPDLQPIEAGSLTDHEIRALTHLICLAGPAFAFINSQNLQRNSSGNLVILDTEEPDNVSEFPLKLSFISNQNDNSADKAGRDHFEGLVGHSLGELKRLLLNDSQRARFFSGDVMDIYRSLIKKLGFTQEPAEQKEKEEKYQKDSGDEQKSS